MLPIRGSASECLWGAGVPSVADTSQSHCLALAWLPMFWLPHLSTLCSVLDRTVPRLPKTHMAQRRG